MHFTRLSCPTPHDAKIVSLEEVKAHLFISHDDEDSYLEHLASTATAMIDGPDGIGVSIAPATYRLSLSHTSKVIELPIHPVTAIETIAVDGLPVSGHRFESDRTPARIYLEQPLCSEEEDGVKITFTAGYSTAPTDLKHAALLLIGHFYRHREATTEFQLRDLPFAVKTILDRYRA